MQEEWRPVPQYEGLYEVSNTGKVRSVNRSFNVTRSKKTSNIEHYSARRTSTELKPYTVNKSGRIKYHLHKRIAHGVGSHKQSDEYVYADDLVRAVFPELFKYNCVDFPCKYRQDDYCVLHDRNILDNIDVVGCADFILARTCLDCKWSRRTVYETGTIDDIEYRCTLQDNKLIYDDLNPGLDHYSDIPECNCMHFECIASDRKE